MRLDEYANRCPAAHNLGTPQVPIWRRCLRDDDGHTTRHRDIDGTEWGVGTATGEPVGEAS